MQSGFGINYLFPRARCWTKSLVSVGACGVFLLTINILQILFDARLVNGFFQDAIINRLFLDLGKQIRDNTIEKLDIILQELGYVGIPDSPQTDQFLLRFKTSELQRS